MTIPQNLEINVQSKPKSTTTTEQQPPVNNNPTQQILF